MNIEAADLELYNVAFFNLSSIDFSIRIAKTMATYQESVISAGRGFG